MMRCFLVQVDIIYENCGDLKIPIKDPEMLGKFQPRAAHPTSQPRQKVSTHLLSPGSASLPIHLERTSSELVTW